MFTHPYSIYIDKRPLRIVFLVDPSPDSIDKVDRIIKYNRYLWGGRYNPIILTDGNTIEEKWWKFLRDIDPDIIKPLVPLSIGLIKKFEKFLSPLTIEKFTEDTQLDLVTGVNTRITPAGIDINSSNIYKDLVLLGEPVLGTFDVDEMDDDIGKFFLLRNFGTYERTNVRHHIGGRFWIPMSFGDILSQGIVPPEIHVGFERSNIPFSNAVISKESLQRSECWVLLDRENKQRHYVQNISGRLCVFPETRSFSAEFGEIKKEVFLITNRSSLVDTLLELSRAQNVVYRDQICAFPNTERDIQNGWQSHFEVVVGDTLQDIVHFWNRPWLLGRWRRKYMNQLLLPTILATDPSMEEALCSWIKRNAWKQGNNPETVQFVSFSTELPELENIAGKFQEKLEAFTYAKHYTEPQIPNFDSEHLSFFLDKNPLSSRDSSIETHRAQGNQDILEVTEPNSLAQHDSEGHWMADFYIEFTHNRSGNHEDIIRRVDDTSSFWKFPNRNHLTSNMFNRFSRIKQNGFPSALMKRGEKVLKLMLESPESVVASLFYSNNRYVCEDRDPRVQVATAPYYHSDVSDKGKYLQGLLELFGNLTFAYEIFRNPYWREMFDLLSKNTRAEQGAEEAVANKLRKLIVGSGPLTSANQSAIKALAKQTVNLAKNLTLKQRESPFKAFIAEAQRQRNKNVDNPLLTNDRYGMDLLFQLCDSREVLAFANRQHEMDIIDFGFRPQDVKDALSQLIEKNIIQIGVKPRCRSCGMASWYHIDDIGQQLTCQGCRSPFPLDPELTWQYRLNSLVYAAYTSHGTTPVILVLGQLFRESRISFFFSPNLNLLAAPQDEFTEKQEIEAEVDIACIQDGKFIIGEVKQSMSLFRKKDFDDMAEIARRTKPDIVLFSCMDSDEPTRLITKNIERIQSELSPLEIDVQWYELEALDYSYRV